jgi:hypothetical protein
MEYLIIIGIIAFVIYLQIDKKKEMAKREARGEFDYRNSENHPFFKSSDYKYKFKNSSIAINKAERNVLLSNEDYGLEIYPFEKIKSWRFNIESGGMYTGGGISGATANIQNLKRQKENSGFFVSVKDIEKPEWRIGIDPYDKSAEKTMKKWMEIFDQFVNNNT